MVNKIIVRRAEMQDLETLFKFEQGVITAERPFDPTLKDDPIHYYELEQMIISPVTYLVVATSGNDIIGSGYCRIEPEKAYLRHSHRGYLGFMYTLPSWRGKGINSLIIEELKVWAKSKGLTELRLDVYFQNEKAIHAYEKSGFSPYMIHMRMGLAPE